MAPEERRGGRTLGLRRQWRCSDPGQGLVPTLPLAAGQGARPAAALAFRHLPCVARRTTPILLASTRASHLVSTAPQLARYPGNWVKIVAELRASSRQPL